MRPVSKVYMHISGATHTTPTITMRCWWAFNLLADASALMDTYFGLLETSARWLESKGMSYGQASDYLKQLYAGLAHAMITSPAASFDIMRWDFSTKGGLNEQVLVEFDVLGERECW